MQNNTVIPKKQRQETCTTFFLLELRFAVPGGIPDDQASISFAVRDELSFPVELQQSLAAEAEAKRQHQVRVSNCTCSLQNLCVF